VDIDEVFERKAAVNKGLHLIVPYVIDKSPNVGGMIGHLVEHLSIGLAEPVIVLEKIAVAINMGNHGLLIDKIISPEKVGVTRIIVDHHLVDDG
jgi:hypothetical protein